MPPIQDLLNRILWDKDFARGKFELGYYDRVERRVITVPFQSVEFPAENPGMFTLVDEEGTFHQIPFHRVREVWKDGQRIWKRN
ncbi:MAG TPA: DUF504 domain-containing protein [Candidatus Sulfotelmatobacter sp.]|nr:DUF504 domain-containing protein [Candidatus Sulfotelmatobacter sp.]